MKTRFNSISIQIVAFALVALLPSAAYSQVPSQDLDDIKYQEIVGYFEGREVDLYRRIQTDTVFFVDTKMLVYPTWYEKRIDSVDYILIRYPKFDTSKGRARDGGIGETPRITPDSIMHQGLWRYNGKTIAIKRTDFEELTKRPIYNTSWSNWKNYKFVSGQLTLPFKLRPPQGEQKFQMTTDVTIGAYGGLRKRLSARSDVFVTVPATLGLSYINLNSNSTSPDKAGASSEEDRIVPGVSWATGVLFQISKFNAGVAIGRDYASQVADDWIYHNKTWYSFAIGYSFSTSD